MDDVEFDREPSREEMLTEIRWKIRPPDLRHQLPNVIRARSSFANEWVVDPKRRATQGAPANLRD